MEDKKKQSKGKQIELKVNARLLEVQKAEESPHGVAYAFSGGGRLIDSGKLDEKGVAVLSLPTTKEAQSVRVMVGPSEKTPRVSELLRRGAEGRKPRIDPGQSQAVVDILVIPEKWLCWLLSFCSVPGSLMKRVEVDGIPTDLPVCGAEVEVCEVDPITFVVPRLPDHIIQMKGVKTSRLEPL